MLGLEPLVRGMGGATMGRGIPLRCQVGPPDGLEKSGPVRFDELQA